jgi:hypothetical protein
MLTEIRAGLVRKIDFSLIVPPPSIGSRTGMGLQAADR